MEIATVGQFYTAPEVAELLGVSRTKAWQWAREGLYEAQRAGRNFLFPREVIDRAVVALREHRADAS